MIPTLLNAPARRALRIRLGASSIDVAREFLIGSALQNFDRHASWRGPRAARTWTDRTVARCRWSDRPSRKPFLYARARERLLADVTVGPGDLLLDWKTAASKRNNSWMHNSHRLVKGSRGARC